MRPTFMTLFVASAATAGLLVACGADDRGAPEVPVLQIAKPDSESGDEQVAPAGTLLGRELRVVVTHDDLPAPDVEVIWSTTEGTVTPVAATTDAQGVAAARWKLQKLFAQQVTAASLGSGPRVTFTAIATPDPAASNTVIVSSEGGNRFDPAEITITVGDTVNWLWPEGSSGHNVVPDDGDSPPHSGPLAGFPKFHSFRFEYPGVYHYHCMAHGGVGGTGMSGTVTVLPSPGQQ